MGKYFFIEKKEKGKKTFVEVCNICKVQSKNGKVLHEDWCENVGQLIYKRFDALFKEIYNIIELSFDEKKAEIAKDLMGDKIVRTRDDILKFILSYMRG